MKQIFFFSFALFAIFLVGCTPSTEFDEKTVTMIVVETTEGMTDVPYRNTRTFDFTAGTVADDCVADVETLVEAFRLHYEQYLEEYGEYPEDETPESYEEKLKARFNHPSTVAEFTEEQGAALLEKVISDGIYTWKDRYETNDIICDGGSETITIYFSDGTSKSTYFYFEYPKNFDTIENDFKEILKIGFPPYSLISS